MFFGVWCVYLYSIIQVIKPKTDWNRFRVCRSALEENGPIYSINNNPLTDGGSAVVVVVVVVVGTTNTCELMNHMTKCDAMMTSRSCSRN